VTIEIRSLSVRYRRIEALRGVSMTARRGVVTAILGPNGAGKTTLLRAMIGALRPQSGVVMLDGEAISSVARRHRAARLAYVAQRPLMATALSVRETVELGRFSLTARPDRVDAALATQELADLAERRVTALSTGQQQRVAMARALAQVEPDGMLVLDEPAAALDFARVRSLVRLLRRFAATGGGVVVTVHDITLASALADVVWILDDGKLVAEGNVADLLRPERLEPIFGVPFRSFHTDDDRRRILMPDIAPADEPR